MVSLPYLKEVHDTINSAYKTPVLHTFGDAFDVLQYLADNGVVELQTLSESKAIYKIRKVEYSG